MTTSIDALADAVLAHLDARPVRPDVIALGEPVHSEPAFPRLWSRVLDRLVERGVRSVALETDAVAAGTLDAWVRGGPGRLDDVLLAGFSHGFGERPGMPELVATLRVRNDELPAWDRITLHGFDLPTESAGAPSPRPHLERLRAYLVETLGPAAVAVGAAELDGLLGPDEPWGTWAAQLDPTASVGASPGAVALRAVADDLVVVLHSAAPSLVAATSLAAWREADVHGRAALGLLRYHAVAARTHDDRYSALLGVRDAEMARLLLAVLAREQHRGATLVLAHDAHLQRARSSWNPDGPAVSWFSAGSIVAAELGLGERYVHVAGALGASTAVGLGTPLPGTVEAGLLASAGGSGLVVDPALDGLRPRDDGAARGYVAPTAGSVAAADGVVVLDRPEEAPEPDRAPSVTDLAARLLARPGVTNVRADTAEGAPEAAHGDWFFFAGPDDRMPFATIVVGDYPGFDEASRLDRSGVFRLNLGVGREAAAEVATEHEPDELDRFLPHPQYAPQGWVSILCPGAGRLAEIDRLVAAALARARGRSS